MRPLVVALFLALAAAPAAAGPFDGTWSEHPAHCAEANPGRVTIHDRELRYWEDRCTLGPPRAAQSPAGAVVHDAACTGLDWEWSGRIALIPLPDGRLAIQEGEDVTTYHRCP